MNKDGIKQRNNKYYFIYKTIGDNYQITAHESDLYDDEDTAASEYQKVTDAYDKALAKIKKQTSIRFTLSEYLDYWLSDICIPNGEGKSTTFLAAYAVNQVVKPAIKQDVLLGYVSADMLNDIIDSIGTEVRTKQETASRFLRKTFQDAYLYGYIRRDISRDIKVVRVESQEIRYLKHEEITTLLNAACDRPHFLEYCLALFCGLRTGEIRGLKFSDCCREELTISIERQITKEYKDIEIDKQGNIKVKGSLKERSPKTECGRRKIRVAPLIFQLLEERQAYNRKIKPKAGLEDYICISSTTGVLKSTNTLYNDLSKLCSATGITPGVSMHGLRHNCATLLLESGDMDLDAIRRFLGHKSVTTTMNIYCGIINSDNVLRKVLEEKIDPNRLAEE